MLNPTHTYDFSFVAPGRKPRTRPQLAFTLHIMHVPELIERLYVISERWKVEEYLSTTSEFTLPTPDLFGKTEFGYSKCGYITSMSDRISLRLELNTDTLHHVTATIHVLMIAFGSPFASPSNVNRSQSVEFMTVCDSRETFYGHAVQGRVSDEVSQWLLIKSRKLTSDNWLIKAPPAVAAAMKQAWTAVAAPGRKRWASECTAYIAKEGRFILNCCVGNACDLAIYPDSLGNRNGSVEFGCHNLDRADQQVTLLAGLAKLCELAAASKLK